MNIIHTAINGLLIIEPKVFGDSRGYFVETWRKELYEQAGIFGDFVQDNESKSRYGVIRGLHWQEEPYSQGKLVRVVFGSVLDVAVDIRKDSPTFGQHVSVELSGENKRQMYIPHGFAHGFAVLSDEAVFAYKCDCVYEPSSERGMRYDDPSLAIDWQIPQEKRILSYKDMRLPSLSEALHMPT